MKKQLSGAMLKWIATVTMFIDHFGAVILSYYIIENGGYFSMLPWEGDGSAISNLYSITRLIGRLAFPIYCFLLVEGFYHTRNHKKFLFNLGAFAIISEIPFNLAISNKTQYPYSQNIFFTLFLGALTMYISMLLVRKYSYRGSLFGLFIAIAIAYLNEYIAGDYGYYGILFIIIIYNLRYQRLYQTIAAFVLGISQYTAFISSILMYLYNGKRGKQPKYFFYIFYPAHLLLLYILRRIIF